MQCFMVISRSELNDIRRTVRMAYGQHRSRSGVYLGASPAVPARRNRQVLALDGQH